MFVEHLKTHNFYYEVDFAHTLCCFLKHIYIFWIYCCEPLNSYCSFQFTLQTYKKFVSMILVFFCEFLVEENSCANANNFTTILVTFHCFCCFPIFSIIFTRSFSSSLFSSFFLWLLSFSQQQHHKSTTYFSATLLCSYLLNPVLNHIQQQIYICFLVNNHHSFHNNL